MDLIIDNARLRGRDGQWTLVVTGERITTIGRAGFVTMRPPAADDHMLRLDAHGGLVTESFVDAHLHLCKVYTLDRIGDDALTAYTGPGMGSSISAIELAARVKADYEEGWIYDNARRAVLDGVANGVLHVLAFADVDTRARLEGVRALLRLRDELDEVVTIKVVAFPQDGLLRDPGAEDYVREAVALGADVVGGIPWIEFTDDDAREHVRRMCALAVQYGRGVAMLVDDAGDPSLRTAEMLASELSRLGIKGGVACHARAMDVWPEPYFRRFAGLAKRAGLGFVTDPHTGPVRLRGFDLADLGIPVALGQDDIADAYYPYGRHNLLEVAFLASHVLPALRSGDMQRLLDMVTIDAGAVFGIPEHRIAEGAVANVVVHGPASVRELLTEHAPPRYVISRGRLVAMTEPTTTQIFLDQ